MASRWSIELVESVAGSPATVTAARALATPPTWSGLGADDVVVWGSCRGRGSEPYDVAFDHVSVAFSCTCPSRKSPCKHAVALAFVWVDGLVPVAQAPPAVAAWRSRRAKAVPRQPSSPDADGAPATTIDGGSGTADGRDAGSGGGAGSDDEDPPPPTDPDRDRSRDDRVARMHAGLDELDRWLDDRMRTGLADPALARYATWDTLAARLVDAQAGSLANRIRRLAGRVGATDQWHEEVLEELGLLHLLSQGGRRLGALPSALGDATATTVGWQVRTADVLAGVPETDDWVVAGRSDRREDRIEVRRTWLRASSSGRWALVLSFAAYRQSLDTSLVVGTAVSADVHRYPGPALRALVGLVHAPPRPHQRPRAVGIEEACNEIGTLLVEAPWLDRVPATVHAAPARSGLSWVLTDDGGSLPLVVSSDVPMGLDGGLTTLLAVSGGRSVDITVEWTPAGVIPLTIHLDDRVIDIGPRADPLFVGAT